jgi:hypothetical protein
LTALQTRPEARDATPLGKRGSVHRHALQIHLPHTLVVILFLLIPKATHA